MYFHLTRKMLGKDECDDVNVNGDGEGKNNDGMVKPKSTEESGHKYLEEFYRWRDRILKHHENEKITAIVNDTNLEEDTKKSSKKTKKTDIDEKEHNSVKHGIYLSTKLIKIAQKDAVLLSNKKKIIPELKKSGKGGKKDFDPYELEMPDYVTRKSRKKKKSKSDKNKRTKSNRKIREYTEKGQSSKKEKKKSDQKASTSGMDANTNKSTSSKPAKSTKFKNQLNIIGPQNHVHKTATITKTGGKEVIPNRDPKRMSNQARYHIEKSKKEEKKRVRKLKKTIERITNCFRNSIYTYNRT